MENKYKVPAKQWKKWNHLQKHIFERTYEALSVCGSIIYPPGMKTTPKQIKVVAWNAAWLAADAI